MSLAQSPAFHINVQLISLALLDIPSRLPLEQPQLGKRPKTHHQDERPNVLDHPPSQIPPDDLFQSVSILLALRPTLISKRHSILNPERTHPLIPDVSLSDVREVHFAEDVGYSQARQRVK